MKQLISILIISALMLPLVGQSDKDRYLGKLSSNRYQSDSTASKSSPLWRSPYSITSKSRYASKGNSPVIIGKGGKYLGRLNKNRYDPDSIANPYGRYGSKYSPDSVNNPYGRYGSRYSNESVKNPYATAAPKLFAPRRSR